MGGYRSVRRLGIPIAVVGVLALAVLGATASSAVADTVPLTLSATVDANGTTINVVAPGCQPSPPGADDIVVQARDATTGAIGEGAVALGTFSAPDQGSVVIPRATPVDSFLLTVRCNGGALTGSQAFTLAPPVAIPVTSLPTFTG
jgi:hypothetical protein